MPAPMVVGALLGAGAAGAACLTVALTCVVVPACLAVAVTCVVVPACAVVVTDLAAWRSPWRGGRGAACAEEPRGTACRARRAASAGVVAVAWADFSSSWRALLSEVATAPWALAMALRQAFDAGRRAVVDLAGGGSCRSREAGWEEALGAEEEVEEPRRSRSWSGGRRPRTRLPRRAPVRPMRSGTGGRSAASPPFSAVRGRKLNGGWQPWTRPRPRRPPPRAGGGPLRARLERVLAAQHRVHDGVDRHRLLACPVACLQHASGSRPRSPRTAPRSSSRARAVPSASGPRGPSAPTARPRAPGRAGRRRRREPWESDPRAPRTAPPARGPPPAPRRRAGSAPRRRPSRSRAWGGRPAPPRGGRSAPAPDPALGAEGIGGELEHGAGVVVESPHERGIDLVGDAGGVEQRAHLGEVGRRPRSPSWSSSRGAFSITARVPGCSESKARSGFRLDAGP